MTDIGLDSKSRKKLAEELSKILAHTFVLYVKTLNFHWNIVGPRFAPLHEFFQEHYEALAEANDELAERIRMLGHRSPGTMKEFLELSFIDESNQKLSEDQMIKDLLEDHEDICQAIRPIIAEANNLHDDGTGDLLIERIRFHEKAAWMLRSHLET